MSDEKIIIIGNGNVIGDGSRSYVDSCESQQVSVLNLDSDEAEAARKCYRAIMRKRHNFIDTHAFMNLSMDDRRLTPKRLPLLGAEGVYVPPLFEILTRMGTRVRSLSQVLETTGHLMIIGEAGSGKSTVLHVVASALTSQSLAPDDLTSVLPKSHPIPVFLPLRLFDQKCAGGSDESYQCRTADLLRFADDWFASWSQVVTLPPGFLAAHIKSGRAWLMLDGLDEVTELAHRQTMRNVIMELPDQVGDTRLIVTARAPACYKVRLDDRFTLVTLRDFDDEQRIKLVRKIYGGLDLQEGIARSDGLIDRFGQTGSEWDGMRTPVLVWIAAVIHALHREVPDSRAALYDTYVNILLDQTFKRTHYDAALVDALTGGEDWPLDDRRYFLTYAAYKVHDMLDRKPDRQSAPEDDRHFVFGERELIQRVLAPYFRDLLDCKPLEANRRARTFVDLMVERSGLIHKTDGGYTFGNHLTMQEFLAGCYLVEYFAGENEEDYEAFLRKNVDRPWWREVFLLAAGFLAEKSDRDARNFLKQIAEQGENPEDRLIALALAGRGLLQLHSPQRQPSWYLELAQQFAGRLYSLLYAEPVDASISDRHEAGLVLGRLYGYPDEDSLIDPRFANPQGLPAFVPIKEDHFWMGSTPEGTKWLIEATGRAFFANESPRHGIQLDAYQIARYPTTNAMFAQFIADDGYKDDQWWDEAINDGRWKYGQVKDWRDKWHSQPRYWTDRRRNNPSQPVVGINWYEAVAYCRWLTAALDDNHLYRLPTEAEWERAARDHCAVVEDPLRSQRSSKIEEGPSRVDWPMDYCNSKETGLGTTSPVGIFHQGAVEDMLGNVWEWCWDWYDEEYYARSREMRNPKGPEKGEYRVVRGGSWRDEGRVVCRCGYRGKLSAWNEYITVGFRCVRVILPDP